MAGPVVVAHGEPDRQLVIGAEGVSETSEGKTVAVAYRDCQAMLAWPDGGRLLVGPDAIMCTVEPTLYPLDPQALRYLDQRVPG
jgi:zinc protease